MPKVEMYYCDFCGKQIPTERKEDMFGMPYEEAKTGKINCLPMYNNMDMERYGFYCCELCAERISHMLDVLKLRFGGAENETD